LETSNKLPNGVQGPFFNDEFGDTFGNIYVLTGKDFDYAVMKEYADRLQLQLQRVKDVAKVNLVGCKIKRFGLKFPTPSRHSIPVTAVQQALQQQNVWQCRFFETEAQIVFNSSHRRITKR
jgi:multidrug efflux pump